MLLIGLGGAWLIAYLWARRLQKNLSLERLMRYGWAQVGDMLEERFTLVNKGWLPALWVEIIDHSTIPGYEVSRATGVESESTNTWITRQICARRGLFTLGPTEMVTGDPFGIYSVTLHDEASASLLVTPQVLPLPYIEVASGGRSGEGRPTRGTFERTVSTSGVRGYVPGDSLRWVHWKTSARRNSPYVKTFDSTPASDWWIVLDLDQQTLAGEGGESTEETGVILAASLADKGLRSGIAVGMAVNSREVAWIPPRMGEPQRLEILQNLAQVTSGPLHLEEFLKGTGASYRFETSLVIITACVDIGWINSLLSLVWKGVIPTVLLIDPQSYGGNLSAQSMANLLADFEITHYVITPDLIDKPKTPADEANAWEWRVMPTGKAIPVQKPKDHTWKGLT